MELITDIARKFAKEYYDEKTYDHACRVAAYVIENRGLIDYEMRLECFALAYMHDLLEDTDFDIELIRQYSKTLANQLEIITHDKTKDTYEEYISKIPRGSCAWWVKMADIKDHLMLKDTLTERLKEKYIGALRILL